MELTEHANHGFKLGQRVLFSENAELHNVPGEIVRVWPNGKYVSIRTIENGELRRLFVRSVAGIQKG